VDEPQEIKRMKNDQALLMENKQRSESGGQAGLKILILTHRFYPEVGGIETNSLILATAFTEMGAEVHVLTWTRYKGETQFPFKVIRDPALDRILKEHVWADVVFENNPCLRLSWPNVFIRKPLVIAVNTWVNRVKGTKGIRDKLKNLWFKRADAVIAVSDAIRRKEWPDAVVIENPYNDKLFKTPVNTHKTKPFIFLGRLVSDKGADQAIKAISILAEKKRIDVTRLQLTITGNGPELENLLKLREQRELYGAVHFTGILKGAELADCLSEHQYILVPSAWEEPYGNVVLEGMACGCVPIASDGGGMPEAVGKAGFVFERNNIEHLAEIMQTALEAGEDINTLRNNAAAHLREHTADLVSKRYFDILQSVAKKK
jgi:glycosyltransferase involved in cell wall biosynthesis